MAGGDGINQFLLKIRTFLCIICLCSCSEQKGHQFFIEGKPWPYIATVGHLSSLFNTLGTGCLIEAFWKNLDKDVQ